MIDIKNEMYTRKLIPKQQHFPAMIINNLFQQLKLNFKLDTFNIGSSKSPVFSCDAVVSRQNEERQVLLSFHGKSKKEAKRRVCAILFAYFYPDDFQIWRANYPENYEDVKEFVYHATLCINAKS